MENKQKRINMSTANDLNFQRFVKENIGNLARACWLAAAWQESNADAEKESDPKESKAIWKDRNLLLRLNKRLRKYQENARKE